MVSKNDFIFKQIVIFSPMHGEKITIKNDNIVIRNENDKIIHQSTCYRLFAIFVVGNTTLSTVLIQHARKFGFSIVFFTSSFRPYYALKTTGEANVLLRQRQYEYNGLDAAKCIVLNKITNQRKLISQIRNKSIGQKEAIKTLDKLLPNILEANDIRQLMGIEGIASKEYFGAFFSNINWQGRQPRIKRDMVNSLLDIGYTILFGYIEALLSIYGFDLYKGVLHRQFYMRKSLVCDLVEPFRVIIDRCVKKGIRLRQFCEDDFIIASAKWQLEYKNSSRYTQVFLSEILKYKEEIFLYIQRYYRSVMKGSYSNIGMWEI